MNDSVTIYHWRDVFIHVLLMVIIAGMSYQGFVNKEWFSAGFGAVLFVLLVITLSVRRLYTRFRGEGGITWVEQKRVLKPMTSFPLEHRAGAFTTVSAGKSGTATGLYFKLTDGRFQQLLYFTDKRVTKWLEGRGQAIAREPGQFRALPQRKSDLPNEVKLVNPTTFQ